MAQEFDLKQMQRKAWMSYFEDGLLDICLGFLLMILGTLLSHTGQPKLWASAIFTVLFVFAFVMFWGGKRLISIRRLGRVRFGPAVRVKSKRARVIAAILVVAQVIVITLTMEGANSAWEGAPGGRVLFALGLGAWMMLVFSVVSYLVYFTRGYAIGALYGLGFSGTILFSNPIILLVAGIVIVLTGLVVFIRFLREYPVAAQGPPSERAPDGNQ